MYFAQGCLSSFCNYDYTTHCIYNNLFTHIDPLSSTVNTEEEIKSTIEAVEDASIHQNNLETNSSNHDSATETAKITEDKTTLSDSNGNT